MDACAHASVRPAKAAREWTSGQWRLIPGAVILRVETYLTCSLLLLKWTQSAFIMEGPCKHRLTHTCRVHMRLVPRPPLSPPCVRRAAACVCESVSDCSVPNTQTGPAGAVTFGYSSATSCKASVGSWLASGPGGHSVPGEGAQRVPRPSQQHRAPSGPGACRGFC